MEEKLAPEISAKLNVLIALSFKQVTGDTTFEDSKRRSGIGEKARFLANFGLEPKDIGDILGAPITSVRTLLTPKRRK